MSEQSKQPLIATVKIKDGRLYLPYYIRQHSGIGNDPKLEVYLTDTPGELILKKRSISKIIKDQRLQAGTDYMNRAIRAKAGGADQEKLEKLRAELDEKIEAIKKLRDGKE